MCNVKRLNETGIRYSNFLEEKYIGIRDKKISRAKNFYIVWSPLFCFLSTYLFSCEIVFISSNYIFVCFFVHTLQGFPKRHLFTEIFLVDIFFNFTFLIITSKLGIFLKNGRLIWETSFHVHHYAPVTNCLVILIIDD